jgi:hypothetical protein
MADAGVAAAADEVEVLRHRLRLALELVHDPCVAAFKSPTAMAAVESRDSARQLCLAMIRHVWALVEPAYGVRVGKDFYAIHRPGDPRNCLTLTTSLDQAERIVAWWAGPAMSISTVTSMETLPERWIAMAVAVHWAAPAWLLRKKSQ